MGPVIRFAAARLLPVVVRSSVAAFRGVEDQAAATLGN
jgi:hypothetical protein